MPQNTRDPTSIFSALLLIVKQAAETRAADKAKNSGYIRHVKSGMFLHPQEFKAAEDSPLVLYSDLGPSGIFVLLSDGNIQHQQSVLYIHPLGGTAMSNVPLILHPHGPEPRLAFEIVDSCIRHRDSGLYVHPENGKAAHGEGIMSHPDGPDRAFPGEIAFKFEAPYVGNVSAISTHGFESELEDARVRWLQKSREASTGAVSDVSASNEDSDGGPACAHGLQGHAASVMSAHQSVSLNHLVQEILRTEQKFYAQIQFALTKPLFFFAGVF